MMATLLGRVCLVLGAMRILNRRHYGIPGDGLGGRDRAVSRPVVPPASHAAPQTSGNGWRDAAQGTSQAREDMAGAGGCHTIAEGPKSGYGQGGTSNGFFD